MLRRMTEQLRHRGPDEQGFHLAPGIGLGVQRLAINDLAGGSQPIASADGSLTLVCNGEIYNFVELQRELEARGHRFRSRSDVEVILHLYEELGPACLARLRGMFAFALWDGPRRRLLLARDRIGIKPLAYALTAEGCWFASEYKAILAGGRVEARLDPDALADLLEIGFVLSPRSLCAGVRKLPPGHYLLWQDGRARLERYWQVSFPRRQDEERGQPERVWVERVRDKLEETVRLHLRADVPYAAWLSPGLDSSGVVALTRQAAQRSIETFSVGFDDPAADELHRASLLADYPQYGLVGHRVRCGRADLALLPRLVWQLEDPLAYLIELPRYLLARAAGARFKVVLTGEGADEVFGGYPWYRADRLLAPFGRLPAELRGRLGPLVGRAFPWGGRALAAPDGSRLERYRRLITPLPNGWQGRLPSAELGAARRPIEERWDDLEPPDLPAWRPLNQLLYFDLTVRLPGFILHELDRSTMACSLEARVPYLDHELVELAARVPADLKLRGLREKYVLRRALWERLPREIASRRKWGLRSPTEAWLRGGLPPFAEALLRPEALRASGYFEPAAVAGLLEQQRAGGRVASTLTAVLVVQLWDELFRRGTPLASFEAVS